MVFAFLRLVLLALGIITTAIGVLLLLVSETSVGVAFGIGGISLGGAFLFAMMAVGRRSKMLWPAAGITFFAWLVATGWIVIQAPTGRMPEGAAVQHRYIGGRDGFRRYAWGNL